MTKLKAPIHSHLVYKRYNKLQSYKQNKLWHCWYSHKWCFTMIMDLWIMDLLPSVAESWLPSARPLAVKSASLKPSHIRWFGTRKYVHGRPCKQNIIYFNIYVSYFFSECRNEIEWNMKYLGECLQPSFNGILTIITKLLIDDLFWSVTSHNYALLFGDSSSRWTTV